MKPGNSIKASKYFKSWFLQWIREKQPSAGTYRRPDLVMGTGQSLLWELPLEIPPPPQHKGCHPTEGEVVKGIGTTRYRLKINLLLPYDSLNMTGRSQTDRIQSRPDPLSRSLEEALVTTWTPRSKAKSPERSDLDDLVAATLLFLCHRQNLIGGQPINAFQFLLK